MGIPESFAKKLIAAGVLKLFGADYYYPENTTLTITLTVNDQEIVLTDEMLTAGKAINGYRPSRILKNPDPARYENTAQWVLGGVFLENFCVGFDYSAGRIGISKRAPKRE
jgi:hypothetical protein